MMDPDTYFKNVKVINFDIICNQVLSKPMHKLIETYQTVHETDSTKCTLDAKEKFVSSAMRNQTISCNHYILKKMQLGIILEYLFRVKKILKKKIL